MDQQLSAIMTISSKYAKESHTPVVSLLLVIHAILLALPGFLLLTIPGPTMNLLEWEVCNMTVVRLNAVLMLTIAYLTFKTLQTAPMHCLLSLSVLIFFDISVALAILLSVVEDLSARNWSFSAALCLSIMFSLIWVYYRGHYDKTLQIRELKELNERQKKEDEERRKKEEEERKQKAKAKEENIYGFETNENDENV